MRRTSSMTMDRTPEAVQDRPGAQARLLPTSHSRLDHSLGWGIPLALSRVEACPEPRRRGSQERNGRGLLFSPTHLNTHYKRCPKAQRLCLRSDQSPSRPLHGRSPDKLRHTLLKGYCQVRAPLTRRIGIAPSGDAPEHGVITLPWAIAPPWATAPFSDSPGVDLAGQSVQSDERRLKTNAPYKDSPVAALGEADPRSGGNEYTLPLLRMVERFWWSRLPQTENFSGLVHIPSEVRGCRRVVADVNRPQGRTPRIATGVDAFSHKPSGTFHPSPNKSKQSLNPMNHSADGNAPAQPLTTPLGEPVRPRRIIPDPDRVADAPRRESIPRGGAAHPERSFKCAVLSVRLWRRASKGRAGGGPRLPIRSASSPTNHERSRLTY